jgi:formylglycine-generating enzyme required for sulfatase activity
MSGNVAEWTETPYYDEAYEFAYFVNPKLVNSDSKRRVVRGGSWKDVSYFLKVATRDYEYADSARSYIGFRTVRDFVGNTDIR